MGDIAGFPYLVVPRPKDTTDDASDQLFALPGDELLDMLSAPMLTLTPPTEESGGAAGGVATAAAGAQGQTAGLLDLGSGIKAGARRFLNFTTYYQMKERAGQVGAGGLNSVLRHLRTHGPAVRLHLIGHSFGGRLVAAAADGPGDAPAVRIDSLTLLQAAFSHNGFAPRFDGTHDGFFRKIVAERKVAGPIVVTYTVNDKAVGLAYPLSSRLARQQSSALGNANDPYGGIGRNGAVKTPEARGGELLAAGGPYAFAPGAIYNLGADADLRHPARVLFVPALIGASILSSSCGAGYATTSSDRPAVSSLLRADAVGRGGGNDGGA